MKIEIKINEQSYVWEMDNDKFDMLKSLLNSLGQRKLHKETLIEKIKNYFSKILTKKDDSDKTPLGIGA